MSRWYGNVGYVVTKESETRPGVYVPIPVERPYSGDLNKNISKWVTSGNVNDDVSLSNQISIVADPFAYENFSSIKYVEFMNAVWEVSSAEVQYPRIILTVGGVYNGKRPQDEPAE